MLLIYLRLCRREVQANSKKSALPQNLKPLLLRKKIKCVAIPGGIVLVGVASFLVYRKLNDGLSTAKKLTKEMVNKNFRQYTEVDLSEYTNLTSIDFHAFKDCTNLREITLPENVTEIGEGAFSGCKNLTSITLPSSVTSIGRHAFYDCTSLTSITLPNGVTKIKNSAFSGCASLTNIDFSNCTNLTPINYYAFVDCTSLKSIKAPEALRTTRFSILELPKDCSIKYV